MDLVVGDKVLVHSSSETNVGEDWENKICKVIEVRVEHNDYVFTRESDNHTFPWNPDEELCKKVI